MLRRITVCSRSPPESCANEGLDASVVLTSSANAVVPKQGSEAYDVSKAAVNHLVREFAISLAPKVRVNGISPPRLLRARPCSLARRVVPRLNKYRFPHDSSASDEQLRTLLAEFYAQRTLKHRPMIRGLRLRHLVLAARSRAAPRATDSGGRRLNRGFPPDSASAVFASSGRVLCSVSAQSSSCCGGSRGTKLPHIDPALETKAFHKLKSFIVFQTPPISMTADCTGTSKPYSRA